MTAVEPGPASTVRAGRIDGPVTAAALDALDVIASDAFAGSVGKRVTVRGPDGQVIGHGTVIGADGSCEITLTGGRPLDDLLVDDLPGLKRDATIATEASTTPQPFTVADLDCAIEAARAAPPWGYRAPS